jgi:hypothetical protein
LYFTRNISVFFYLFFHLWSKKVCYSKNLPSINHTVFHFNNTPQLGVLCNWLFLVYLRIKRFSLNVFVRNSFFFFDSDISFYLYFNISSKFPYSLKVFFLQFTLFLNFLPKMEFFFFSVSNNIYIYNFFFFFFCNNIIINKMMPFVIFIYYIQKWFPMSIFLFFFHLGISFRDEILCWVN